MKSSRPEPQSKNLAGASVFFAQFPQPLLVIDESWQISHANRAAEQAFHKDLCELPGCKIWELWPPPLQDDIEQRHRQSLRHGAPVEFLQPPQESSERWFELRMFKCEFGIVAHYMDITEPRRIAELQDRISAIVESADDAIVSKDLNGIITSWNPGAERVFGYKAEEVVGKHISILAAPEKIDEFPGILAQVSRGQRIDHYETKRRTKDGRTLTISLTVSPVRDASGRIIGASKVARDITDQKKIMEVQERLAAIVQSSDDAILSKDLDGIITSWNRGAEKLFGYKAEEIIGKHISALAPPEVADEIPRILERLRRGELIDRYETKRKTKDGRILTVSLTVSPLRDASGRVIGASKVARDITDRERQERALQAANAALRESNEDLQQFAYSASHDLQEPLRMVSIYSEMVKQKFGGTLGPGGEEYLKFVIDGAARMEQLLTDLRAYIRASTSEEELAGNINANEALERALRSIEPLIEQSGAVVIRTALPRVHMHSFQLEQVFRNLIGNAVRYHSDEAPRIEIAAGRQGGDWLFSVKDNGIGIDPQYKEHVFGIFKRLHSASEYPGTGMGLAICQRIVQRAGGRIWVESELGKGATFFFTLPWRED